MTTLRARLALLVGLLTALAVSAVAVGGYHSTSTRLDQELDSSLQTLAARLSDPDGRSARSLCLSVSQATADTLPLGLVSQAGGYQVQCIDQDGTYITSNGSVRLPIDATDTRLATGRIGLVRLRTSKVRGEDLRIATVTVPFGAVQIARSTSERNDVLASLRARYLLLVAGVSVFAAAVGWMMTRRATAPITALTTAAEQIATTGSLEVDIPTATAADVATKDETRRLARSFSTMVENLRQSREQQARLVQDAGHELRTPLTSLRANVDVLRRHPDLAGPPRERLLSDLDSELRELTGLTDELVALASATGTDEPMTPLDLGDLGRRAVERLQRRSDRPIVLDAQPAPCTGRARLLQRAVDNLVDNAAKFSPVDASIDITVRPGFVQVRDHGPGVPPEDLDRVFDRFYRSLAARTLPGSGLGLSIVKDVVTSHDGFVTVSNHPEGGAVFTIHLPVPPPAGVPAPPTAATTAPLDAYLG